MLLPCCILYAIIQSPIHLLRFKELKDPELQFKFVRLQCDLVEDFRMRLVQILRQEQNFPLSDKFCLILSAAHHLIEVLSSWNETPLYLHLQYVMNDDDMLNSVTEGFSYLIVDRVNSLSMYIYYEAKARSGSYRSKTRW